MPGSEPTITWIEIAENRYGPGGNIGDADEPAFRIETGPVLRDW